MQLFTGPLLGYNLAYILSAVGASGILAFIFYRGTRKKFDLLYAGIEASLIIWSIGRLALLYVDGPEAALFWGRFLHIGSILTHILFVHTILVFVDKEKSRKIPLAIFYLNAISLLLLNFSDILFGTSFFLKELTTKSIFTWLEIPSGLYHLHLINELIIPIWAFYELIRAYLKMVGVKKAQLFYIILSSTFGFVGGNSIVPVIYNIPFPSIFVFLVPIHIVTMAYAIFKLRLMDIRLIIARALAFGILVGILVVISSIVSGLIAKFLSDIVGSTSTIISGIIISILVVVGYKPIVKLVEKATDKFLFKKSYDSDELLANVSEVAAKYIQMDKLSEAMHKTLYQAFQFEKFGVALLDEKGDFKIVFKDGFKPGVAEGLVSFPDVASIFIKEIQQTPGILVIDEMQTRFENKEFTPVSPVLLKTLHDNNIAIAIPLYVKDNLTGVMVLGSKKSGDPYNSADVNVLGIIGGQVAVAIDNAKLYDELRYFNVKLEKEVQEKTKLLQKANIDLQKLDQAKPEFISIASHQLRTPLTIIKGYISMIREGSFGPVRPKILSNLEKVYISNERLIQLVENLLDISRIESGRQEFAWKKVQLENLAKEIAEKMQENAKKKNLKLTFHAPTQHLPEVIIDETKLHEVMINFVDNAIKYTETGSIDVYVKPEPKGMITFCVKDTGKGISEEGKQKLFKKFSRGKDSFRQHTEGLGLGLYVATMMMKAHEGKIWADSEGEGKGSSFCFSIPIKNKHKDGEVSKIDEKIVEEAQADIPAKAARPVALKKKKKK